VALEADFIRHCAVAISVFLVNHVVPARPGQQRTQLQYEEISGDPLRAPANVATNLWIAASASNKSFSVPRANSN
jgi:hypothetical protein